MIHYDTIFTIKWSSCFVSSYIFGGIYQVSNDVFSLSVMNKYYYEVLFATVDQYHHRLLN